MHNILLLYFVDTLLTNSNAFSLQNPIQITLLRREWKVENETQKEGDSQF